MRPVSLVLPPIAPSGLNAVLSGPTNSRTVTLSWQDNSITETQFLVQRSTNLGSTWTTAGTIQSPLNTANIHQTRTFVDPSRFNQNATNTRYYRVIAQNTVGYVADPAYPQVSAQSFSNTKVIGASFTITASSGAGGTISPTGAVVVGRAGSQTFTITPNAGYKIADRADGRREQLGGGDVRHLHVHQRAGEPHDRRRRSRRARPRSPRAPGPTVPSRRTAPRTVAINGSQTYTITANPNYVRATRARGRGEPAGGCDVRLVHVHERGGATTRSWRRSRPLGSPSHQARVRTAASRRTPSRPWRAVAVRASRSLRTRATTSPRCSWTA